MNYTFTHVASSDSLCVLLNYSHVSVVLYEAAQINNFKVVIKAAELVPEICYVQEFCLKTLY